MPVNPTPEREPAFYRYLRIPPYIMRKRRGLVDILEPTIISVGASALIPWPLMIIVDFAVTGLAYSASIRTFVEDCVIALTVSILMLTLVLANLLLYDVNAAFDTGLSWMWLASGQLMVADLINDLFGHQQHLSLSFDFQCEHALLN